MTLALFMELLVKSGLIAGVGLALSWALSFRPARDRVDVLRAASVLVLPVGAKGVADRSKQRLMRRIRWMRSSPSTQRVASSRSMPSASASFANFGGRSPALPRHSSPALPRHSTPPGSSRRTAPPLRRRTPPPRRPAGRRDGTCRIHLRRRARRATGWRRRTCRPIR